MATLGTTTTTKLTSYRFPGAPDSPRGQAVPSVTSPTAAQIATLGIGIKNDQVNVNLTTPAGPIWAGAFHPQGNPTLLHIPNRGVLKILPGDYIAIDSLTGWPILVSSQAVAATGSFWNYV